MKSTTISLLIILVLLIAGWYLLRGHSAPTTPSSETNQVQSVTATTTETNVATSTIPATATVIYGPDGFRPSTVIISKGGTVTFVDQGGGTMWIASNPHPTHEGYSGTTRAEHCPDTGGTAFDECATGTSYTFTFQKIGTWGYHNHFNHSDTGTIIVQ